MIASISYPLRFALILMSAVFVGPSASTTMAQTARNTSLLDERIPAELRPVLRSILDSAAAANLPGSLLADKALEGISKGAPEARVVSAVRTLHSQLRTVREALGSSVSMNELEAATIAFRAGATVGTLKKVQSNLSKRSLIIPYGVLGTLVQRGVSVSEAVNVVVKQAKNGKDDNSLLALSKALERNLAAGLPVGAALIRAQQLPGVVTGPGGGKRRP